MLARCGTTALALFLLLLTASADAAQLPTVTKTVSAPVTKSTACATGGATTYTAPMAGYLNVNLDGKGDWDLAVKGSGGRSLGASQGFGGSEIVQNWVRAGEKLTAVACRRPGATGAARVAFRLVDAKPVTQKGATRVARVQIARQAQVARLTRLGFDATHRQTPHSADVLVNGDAELAKLRTTGLPFKIVTNNLYRRDLRQLRADATATRAGSALPSGREEYRSYEEYGTDLKALVDNNPGLVRPVSLGKSFEGRELSGVEIATDVNGDDGRPTYFVMGVHHAREWPAGEAAMELATLLTKSKSDPRIAKILANERVVIVPLINPDGFVVSRGSFSPSDTAANNVGCPDVPGAGVTTCDAGQLAEAVAPPGGFGAYRRKNCDGVGGMPGAPCETQYGVDINRNYGNLWGGPGGSSDITSQSFHGPAPRSEPETKAVFDFVRTHHVTTLITLHTVAGLVLRPPGLQQVGLAPDENRMKEIGDAMAGAAGYTSQYSFQLYDTAGTTEDDTYAATGGYGYTYELGTEGGPFHGPYADSVVKEWTGDNDHAKGKGGVREALLLGAEAADNPSDHAIVKGSAPAGRVLHLTKKFQTKTSDYCPMGVEPVLNIQAAPSSICPTGIQKAITLDDSLDSKTTVPPSGKFEWHIGQSTRPFVNGGAVFEKPGTPKPVGTDIKGTAGTPGSTADQKVTLPAETGKLTITLSSDLPTDDFDIEVLKDGKSVGTSAGSPGADEVVDISDAAAGDYIVRVTNFLAVAGYTIKATATDVERTVTTGTKEAYILTCEDKAGKVFTSTQLVIDRGQTVTADVCGTNDTTISTVPPSLQTKKVKIRFTGLRLKPNKKNRRIRFKISSPKEAPGVARGRFRLVTKLGGKTAFVASRRFAIKPGVSRTVNPIVRKRVFKALKRGKKITLKIRLTGTAGTLGLEVVTKNFAALKRPR